MRGNLNLLLNLLEDTPINIIYYGLHFCCSEAFSELSLHSVPIQHPPKINKTHLLLFSPVFSGMRCTNGASWGICGCWKAAVGWCSWQQWLVQFKKTLASKWSVIITQHWLHWSCFPAACSVCFSRIILEYHSHFFIKEHFKCEAFNKPGRWCFRWMESVCCSWEHELGSCIVCPVEYNVLIIPLRALVRCHLGCQLSSLWFLSWTWNKPTWIWALPQLCLTAPSINFCRNNSWSKVKGWRWLIAVVLRAHRLLSRIPPGLALAKYLLHGANTLKGTAICIIFGLVASVNLHLSSAFLPSDQPTVGLGVLRGAAVAVLLLKVCAV